MLILAFELNKAMRFVWNTSPSASQGPHFFALKARHCARRLLNAEAAVGQRTHTRRAGCTRKGITK